MVYKVMKGKMYKIHKNASNICYSAKQYQSAQQIAHTPFHYMLPHIHTIYKDVILLNVSTEV